MLRGAARRRALLSLAWLRMPSLSRLRGRIGNEGVKWLLTTTIEEGRA